MSLEGRLAPPSLPDSPIVSPEFVSRMPLQREYRHHSLKKWAVWRRTFARRDYRTLDLPIGFCRLQIPAPDLAGVWDVSVIEMCLPYDRNGKAAKAAVADI